MYKKIILTLLIFSMLIQLIGCYNMQVITKNELIKENKEDEIISLTKNNFQYSLLSQTVVNDSISGTGYVKSVSDSDFSEPYTGTIAMDDILEIKQNEIDWDSTKLLIGVTVISIIIVGGILILDDFSHWGD